MTCSYELLILKSKKHKSGSGSEGTNVVLQPCRVCSRTFHPDALERHEGICEKANSKRRKVFDSFQQRAKGSGANKVQAKKKEEVKKPKPSWKEQHEELIRTIRAEKKIEQTDCDVTPNHSIQRQIPLGYIQCPICLRCFNQKAADRHISWCQEQKSRLPKTPADSVATERLKARIKYRAPLPIKKKDNVSPQKPARPCQSATVPRSHSSPAPLSECSSVDQLTLHSYSEKSKRRNSEKKFHIGKEKKKSPTVNNLVLSSQKSTNCFTQDVHAVKFKEKFPFYNNQNSRAKGDTKETHNKREEWSSNNSKGVESHPASQSTVSAARPSAERLYRTNTWSSTSGLNGNGDELLNMLRMKLADVGNYDDIAEKFNLGPSVEVHKQGTNSCLPEVSSSETHPCFNKDSWTSDGDTRLSTSSGSSSDASLPTLSRGSSSEGRMPRFCYQCGTKYPIASAKYCCECGARRLVFGIKDVKIPTCT